MLKSCKSERHNGYKIALSSNDDKRIQSIDSIETYAHEMSKDLICNRKKNKRLNIMRK